MNRKSENISPFLKLMILLLIAGMLILTGCFRGRPSDKPPVHVNPNMDDQPRYNPQAESGLFRNGTNLTPVPGTVARGELREDVSYYTGIYEDGSYIERSPVNITAENLRYGQERFNIYCSPCHSKIGDGKGIITHYNYTQPRSLHDEDLLEIEGGFLFDVITNGFNDMPEYKYQIPVADRWAIINYIRTLQRSQNAKLSDIPLDKRDEIK